MKFFMWLGIGLFTVPLRGFVLQNLWMWFIVPLGVIALTLPQSIGFAIVVQSFVAKLDYEEKTEDQEYKEIVGAFLVPLWFLGFGWIVQLFI